MNERLQFLAGYIGSAAVAAFLATCLNSPRVATFTCDTPPGKRHEQCKLADTLPVSVATTEVPDARNGSADGPPGALAVPGATP